MLSMGGHLNKQTNKQTRLTSVRNKHHPEHDVRQLSAVVTNDAPHHYRYLAPFSSRAGVATSAESPAPLRDRPITRQRRR
jgi:hypothetical protein